MSLSERMSYQSDDKRTGGGQEDLRSETGTGSAGLPTSAQVPRGSLSVCHRLSSIILSSSSPPLNSDLWVWCPRGLQGEDIHKTFNLEKWNFKKWVFIGNEERSKIFKSYISSMSAPTCNSMLRKGRKTVSSSICNEMTISLMRGFFTTPSTLLAGKWCYSFLHTPSKPWPRPRPNGVKQTPIKAKQNPTKTLIKKPSHVPRKIVKINCKANSIKALKHYNCVLKKQMVQKIFLSAIFFTHVFSKKLLVNFNSCHFENIFIHNLVPYIAKLTLNIFLFLKETDQTRSVQEIRGGKKLTDAQLRALKVKEQDKERRQREKEERERLKRKKPEGGEDTDDDITKKIRDIKNQSNLNSTPSRAGGTPIIPTPKGSQPTKSSPITSPKAILPGCHQTPVKDAAAAAKVAVDAAAAAAAQTTTPTFPMSKNPPASVKAAIDGGVEEEGEEVQVDGADDTESDTDLSDLEEDEDIIKERADRKERQERHKKIKKTYSQACKDGQTTVIRSSNQTDLATKDFQIVSLAVTKFLESHFFKGESVGVGNCGMYKGFIWFEVKNKETLKLFEQYIPIIQPPQGAAYKYLLGPRDDMHKVFTCFVDEFFWDQRDVLERRLRMFTPGIMHKITDKGQERWAHVKIISGGQDKVREVGQKGGFIIRLELEECLIDVLVNKAEKGMEGRVRFIAGSSVELQGNGIEKLVKEKLDKDEEEERQRKERRERIREKKRKRLELLRQKNKN